MLREREQIHEPESLMAPMARRAHLGAERHGTRRRCELASVSARLRRWAGLHGWAPSQVAVQHLAATPELLSLSPEPRTRQGTAAAPGRLCRKPTSPMSRRGRAGSSDHGAGAGGDQ